MKFKLLIILMLILSLSFMGFAGDKEFQKGSFYLTPQVGLNSWAIPFGVNAEYAIKPNIGVGANVMFWFWSEEFISESVIAFMIEGAYHFTQLQAAKFDFYAGLGLGFSTYSWSWKSGFEDLIGGAGSSGLYLEPFAGARYYFTPKIAASFRLNGALVGSWAGFGGTIGVTFRLK